MIFRWFSSRWRAGAACAAAAVALALAFASADAATKKTDKKTEAAKPNLIASFGDWNVFVGQAGKGRICYVLAQPKSREPENLNRDPGYAFISDRPAEGVRNEVSFIMGFDVAGGTTAEASAETATDAKPDAKPAKPRAKPAAKTAKPAKADAKIEGEAEADRRAGRRRRRRELRPPAQGRRPVGQERGARKRPHRRDEEGRDARDQGRLAQGQRIDQFLFALRLLPGDGSAAEGMPAEAVRGLYFPGGP